MADTSYYEMVNPNLVAALAQVSGQHVLEIGCGAGRLGEAMKKAGAARWVGVEVVPEAAQAARARLDEVYAVDVETTPLPLAPASFDVLVLGDVIEHLSDPWGTLKKLCGLLRPKGRVVASIPNVNHSTILASLLGGRWEYQERGLLDRTHLRFFTLDEILRLLEHCGLKPENVESCRATTPALDALCADLDAVRKKHGLGSDRFPIEARTFQWLVQARRAA